MSKKLTTIILALFVCTGLSVASDNDVRAAKRSVTESQQVIKELGSKKKQLEQKIEWAQKDLNKANDKMEKNSEKPESLSYKNAVKKLEELQGKIEGYQTALSTLSHQMDSVYNVLQEQEQALLLAQQPQRSESNAKENVSKQVEEIAEEMIVEKTEEQVPNIEPISSINKEELTDVMNDSSDSGKGSSKSDFTGILSAIGLILLFILGVYWELRKRHRCPHCGRWFDMEYLGDKKKTDHDEYSGRVSARGIQKNYRCNACGQKHSYITWRTVSK